MAPAAGNPDAAVPVSALQVFRCLEPGCGERAPNGTSAKWIREHALHHEYVAKKQREKREARAAAKAKLERAAGPSLRRRINERKIMSAVQRAVDKVKALGKKAARGRQDGDSPRQGGKGKGGKGKGKGKAKT